MKKLYYEIHFNCINIYYNYKFPNFLKFSYIYPKIFTGKFYISMDAGDSYVHLYIYYMYNTNVPILNILMLVDFYRNLENYLFYSIKKQCVIIRV